MDTKFTCALCSGVFDTNIGQRKHMQSSWHIWNLKRRIASLPALSQDIFEEQVVPAHTGALGAAGSQSSLENEGGDALGSDISTEVEYDSGEFDTEDDSDSGFDPHECLFCSTSSPTMDSNVLHMQRSHGLFIPRPELRLNVHALLGYLSSLVASLHECLYCRAQKSSCEAAKAHMLDKGHCKLNLEEIGHLHKFYVSEDEGDGEDDNVDAKGKAADLVASGDVDAHVATAIETIEDLHLPSGKTIGHRSRLRHFHRQHRALKAERFALLPAEETPDNVGGEGLVKAARARFNSHQLTVLANTEKGLVGISEDRKRALRVAEKKILKAECRRRNEFRAGLERQGNKQKHFKNDVPGPKLG